MLLADLVVIITYKTHYSLRNINWISLECAIFNLKVELSFYEFYTHYFFLTQISTLSENFWKVQKRKEKHGRGDLIDS